MADETDVSPEWKKMSASSDSRSSEEGRRCWSLRPLRTTCRIKSGSAPFGYLLSQLRQAVEVGDVDVKTVAAAESGLPRLHPGVAGVGERHQEHGARLLLVGGDDLRRAGLPGGHSFLRAGVGRVPVPQGDVVHPAALNLVGGEHVVVLGEAAGDVEGVRPSRGLL